jgi:hypothetical protein
MPEAMPSLMLQNLGVDVLPGARHEAPELIKTKNGTLLFFIFQVKQIDKKLRGWLRSCLDGPLFEA